MLIEAPNDAWPKDKLTCQESRRVGPHQSPSRGIQALGPNLQKL